MINILSPGLSLSINSHNNVALIQKNRGDKSHHVKATFHLTISMRGQRATGKIQRTNYHHGSCGASLTGKT